MHIVAGGIRVDVFFQDEVLDLCRQFGAAQGEQAVAAGLAVLLFGKFHFEKQLSHGLEFDQILGVERLDGIQVALGGLKTVFGHGLPGLSHQCFTSVGTAGKQPGQQESGQHTLF